MNPKKLVFVVTEGKIMGFIVSKDGIIIDPERIESIGKIGLPKSKKSMQYFLGRLILSGVLFPILHKLLDHFRTWLRNMLYLSGLTSKRMRSRILRRL